MKRLPGATHRDVIRHRAGLPIQAMVFKVIIRSPSLLSEERQAATEAINEWNALHSDAECIVRLPVKWETHAIPTAGVRSQAAINAQLLDRYDILIGMFWTRLGTGTGVAASGTDEEIDLLPIHIQEKLIARLICNKGSAASDTFGPDSDHRKGVFILAAGNLSGLPRSSPGRHQYALFQR